MNRFAAPLFAVTAAACAPAMAAPPPPSAPPSCASRASPPPAPVALAYELARRGDGDGVLLGGRTVVDVHHEHAIEQTAQSPRVIELRMHARPRDDGTLFVDVDYKERSADGIQIEWSPTLLVARGAPTTADVSGAGWGRSLRLTVE